jgi:hypothetical protein
MCSEHNGKTVAICITQDKDDREMAEAIFSSFRWTDETDIFHDVSIDAPQATAIAYAKEHAIISGYPDGTFRPHNPINRAEFTKIIVNAALGSGAVAPSPSAPCFTDVPGSTWFAPFVCTAKTQGIIGGYPDGTFQPANDVNAAEAAKIVVEAFNLPVSTAAAQSIWYQPYWDALTAAGALPESVADPAQRLTRGEMAAMVYGVMQ